MSRGLTAAVVTALKSDVVRPVTFVTLDFASGILYLHDSIGTFTFGGNDYQGVGDFGSVSSIEEGTDIAPYKVVLKLSGLDPTISNIATAGTEDYYLRPVDIYMGLLDEDEALIADPQQIWSGFMDVMTLSTGSKNGDEIQLACESELAKVQRSANLKYTHIQQQRVDSDDLFFEYLQDIENVKILWKDRDSGNLGVGSGTSGGGGGGGRRGDGRDGTPDPGQMP